MTKTIYVVIGEGIEEKFFEDEKDAEDYALKGAGYGLYLGVYKRELNLKQGPEHVRE